MSKISGILAKLVHGTKHAAHVGIELIMEGEKELEQLMGDVDPALIASGISAVTKKETTPEQVQAGEAAITKIISGLQKLESDLAEKTADKPAAQ